MENQKETPRQPQWQYTLCVMLSEGPPKGASPHDVNARNYNDKKERSKEALETLLLKTAAIWGAQIARNIIKNKKEMC